MAEQQHATALGIASKGGKITWTLMSADLGSPVRIHAKGSCARLDELRDASSPVGNPVAAASVIGVGCTSMNPALTALAAGTPVVHIDPLEAYLLAPLASGSPPALPFLTLVASTRFTALVRVQGVGRYSVVGRTRDISAGAVLDKLAWQLGMDVPGGSALERLADFGDPTACALPDAAPEPDSPDFSFLELQTAALQRARELEGSPCEQPRADLAASVQAALVCQLASRTQLVLEQAWGATLVLAGGVTRNATLRQALPASQQLAALPRSHRIATAALLRHLHAISGTAQVAA